MDDEKTALAVCIGTFDASGLPLSIQKYLGSYAQMAFQAICLNMLVSRTLGLGTTQRISVCGKDGESIRIEHHEKGFIAYLEQADTPAASVPQSETIVWES